MTSTDALQMYQGLSRAHFLSPTGQCKAFDADADGYCRAEGCGLFVLKRLRDAISENDRIYGVIRGIEVNQCGNAHSITHPHQETQQALFRQLLSKSHISASTVGVIEAHGTGTVVNLGHCFIICFHKLTITLRLAMRQKYLAYKRFSDKHRARSLRFTSHL